MISAPFIQGVVDGQVSLKSMKWDPSRKTRLAGWGQRII